MRCWRSRRSLTQRSIHTTMTWRLPRLASRRNYNGIKLFSEGAGRYWHGYCDRRFLRFGETGWWHDRDRTCDSPPCSSGKLTTKTYSHNEFKTADHKLLKFFDNGYPVLDC